MKEQSAWFIQAIFRSSLFYINYVHRVAQWSPDNTELVLNVDCKDTSAPPSIRLWFQTCTDVWHVYTHTI